MRINDDNQDSGRVHRRPDTASVPAVNDMVWGRIATALERIADCLVAGIGSSSVNKTGDNELLDLDAVATRLGVSARWVQRHVRPSLRASARGKAWYRIDDVDAQISAPAPQDVERPRKRKAKPISQKNEIRRTQPEAEIAEVERRLRAAMTKPRRGQR